MILYKFLRYLLQAIVIYIALRYTPYVTLDIMKAGIITIILTTFLIALEFIYFSYSLIKEENCDVCKLPPITPPQPTCRVVCDSDPKPKLETFTETKSTDKTPHEAQGQEQVDRVTPQKQPNENYYRDVNTKNLGFGGMFYDDYVGSQNTGTYLSDPEYERKREINEKIALETRRRNMEEQATTTAGYSTPYQEPGAKSETRKSIEHSRRIEGEIDDELIYSDFNTLPVASGYRSTDAEYGYAFIPPERWAPLAHRPPVCVTDRRASIYPSLANGTPVDVKEFHSSLRITPPDRINTAYIDEKLNAGR